MRVSRLFVVALLVALPSPAFAQSRSDQNAITQAEDAFGFSVGRESIGIYNATNTRGFSPIAAGNARIEGLYFDPAADLQSIVLDSVSIKVGTSALGYPFVAPSGVVDETLRKPSAKAGASLILNADQFGTLGAEIDGSVPVTGRLSVAYGLNVSNIHYPDGTHNSIFHQESLVARWRSGKVEIIPFLALYDDRRDQAGQFYSAAGHYLPKMPDAGVFIGPDWSGQHLAVTNGGVLGSAELGKSWLVRWGVFRSVSDFKRQFVNVLADEDPGGSGRWVVIAFPAARNISWSGELRATHSIAEGPRLHLIHLSFRRRDAHQEFGGSQIFDFGPGRFDQKLQVPEPAFQFGPLSGNRIQQNTVGLAYDGRWKHVGELSFGVSRAFFSSRSAIAGGPGTTARSSPLLYNGSIAMQLAKSAIAYLGYARGLEASGVAPPDAANRHEPLPVILTQQKDAGVSFNIASGVKATGGVFELTRPYFGYAAAHAYRQVGTIRSRGAEFSVSGSLTPRLNIVAGGVFLAPRVTEDVGVEGHIGSKPFGLASRYLNLNFNWQSPLAKGLDFDLAINQQGRRAATTDNLVFLPARTLVNVGTHYHFHLARRSATLRLQLYNSFNILNYGLPGPGLYGRQGGRYLLGYLTVDL